METNLISKDLYDLVDKSRESCCLHSLSNKCKEWALTHNYQLHSAIRNGAYPICILIDESNGFKQHFKDDTEPEAVFQACEWILRQKEK